MISQTTELTRLFKKKSTYLLLIRTHVKTSSELLDLDKISSLTLQVSCALEVKLEKVRMKYF